MTEPTVNPTVTIDQALATQRALRAELGLGEEHFPMADFIGMLSDEIEQLREAGRDDAAIAALVSAHSGVAVDAATIDRFYAPEDERHHG